MAVVHRPSLERRRWLRQAGAWAAVAGGLAALGPAGAAAPPGADVSEGEVRKVDKAAGKVTLKHGEIRNLKMPAMTMAFGVKDKALLDTLKVGDKVRFVAVDEGGQLMATQLQPVR